MICRIVVVLGLIRCSKISPMPPECCLLLVIPADLLLSCRCPPSMRRVCQISVDISPRGPQVVVACGAPGAIPGTIHPAQTSISFLNPASLLYFRRNYRLASLWGGPQRIACGDCGLWFAVKQQTWFLPLSAAISPPFLANLDDSRT